VAVGEGQTLFNFNFDSWTPSSSVSDDDSNDDDDDGGGGGRRRVLLAVATTGRAVVSFHVRLELEGSGFASASGLAEGVEEGFALAVSDGSLTSSLRIACDDINTAGAATAAAATIAGGGAGDGVVSGGGCSSSAFMTAEGFSTSLARSGWPTLFPTQTPTQEPSHHPTADPSTPPTPVPTSGTWAQPIFCVCVCVCL
jgi:hypothetical protein